MGGIAIFTCLLLIPRGVLTIYLDRLKTKHHVEPVSGTTTSTNLPQLLLFGRQYFHMIKIHATRNVRETYDTRTNAPPNKHTHMHTFTKRNLARSTTPQQHSRRLNRHIFRRSCRLSYETRRPDARAPVKARNKAKAQGGGRKRSADTAAKHLCIIIRGKSTTTVVGKHPAHPASPRPR